MPPLRCSSCSRGKTAAAHFALATLLMLSGCSRSPTPSSQPTTGASGEAGGDTSAQKAQIMQQVNACAMAQQSFMNGQIQRESANPDYALQPYIPAPGCTDTDMARLTTHAWQLDIAEARARGDTRDACVIEPIRGCDSSQEHSATPEQ